jgi:hypothetical protein
MQCKQWIYIFKDPESMVHQLSLYTLLKQKDKSVAENKHVIRISACHKELCYAHPA